MHPHHLQTKDIAVEDWGRVAYGPAWQRQRAVLDAIVARKVANRSLPEDQQLPTANALFYCEHPHVYTLGKSGVPANLLYNEAELVAAGVEFYPTDRGGDITYHGPGQLVGYPVLDLENFFTDIGRYLRTLEEAVIRTCAEYNLPTGRIPEAGFTGVWVGVDTPFPRKICALGVKCSRWVTLHGFAFNLTTDLSYFQGIVPCGIDPTAKGVTSLYQETGLRPDREEVIRRVTAHLVELLGATVVVPTAQFRWALAG